MLISRQSIVLVLQRQSDLCILMHHIVYEQYSILHAFVISMTDC